MSSFFDTTKHWSKLAAMPQSEVEEHRHPLDYCPKCRYVRCSCGHCHSQECNELCNYETGYKPEKDMRS